MARLYVFLGCTENAAITLEKMLVAYPTDPDIHLMLADLYSALSPAKAGMHLQACCETAPRWLVARARGIYHRQRGDLETACACLRASLAEHETVDVLNALVHTLIEKDGTAADVMPLLERAVEVAPDDPIAYNILAQRGYYTDAEHPGIVFMKHILGSGTAPADARALFHATLGHVFDRLDQCDEAYAHFRAMNAVERRKYRFRVQELIKSLEMRRSVFDQAFFERAGRISPALQGEGVIFIVGMPRSGTTLVEQILASHPDVHGAGEVPYIEALIGRLSAAVDGPYPTCARLLTRALSSDLSSMYMGWMSALAGGRPRAVDKAIDNWCELGLIATLFPAARLIHIMRDARDTCLSCYCANFIHIPYTTDLSTLGRVYREYERMMAHWHTVLPGRILDVQYEALVEKPSVQIARLLAHCDLSWHAACLEPHKTPRPVDTLSATQVKAPISPGSVGRWRRYAKHLVPLIAALRAP